MKVHPLFWTAVFVSTVSPARATAGASERATDSSTTDERTVAFPSYHLTLQLPPLEPLKHTEENGQIKGLWWGDLEGKRVVIRLEVLDAADFLLYEPGDVAEVVVDHHRSKRKGFRLATRRFVTGAYGYAPFAGLVEAALAPEKPGKGEGRFLALCGLVEGYGYVLEVEARSAPSDAVLATLREFLLEGVRYDGPARDPDWTTEKILARWKRDVPQELHEDFEKALQRRGTAKKVVTRTDHYIVLTNSSSGKLFAKQLEKNYAVIAKAFPFEEVEGRRLMPVFLFRTPDQYFSFYTHTTGASREEAERTKGYAWKDYYATWYEAPGDPVHIHECTHQVFANRLRLGGGGSWFQEGVADYVEASKNDRTKVARQVRKGEQTPLRELVQLESLLHSTEDDRRGGSRAGDHYKLAGLLIEFLRESKFGKGKFDRFLETVGQLPRGDAERIDAAFQEIYGLSIEGVEEEWRAYCKKR